MTYPPTSRRRRARALTAATLILPAPLLATTYDLSNTSVNATTAPYTAADTLNCSAVTFSASSTGGTLLAAVNLTGSGAMTTINPLTLAGPLSGSGTFTKSNTGTLT